MGRTIPSFRIALAMEMRNRSEVVFEGIDVVIE